MRSDPTSFRIGHVKAMLTLSAALHEAADPTGRKTQLLEGLRGLIGATCGASVVAHFARTTARRTTVAAVRTPPARGKLPADDETNEAPLLPWNEFVRRAARSLARPNPDEVHTTAWYATIRSGKKNSPAGQYLFSFLPFPGTRLVACVVLRRLASRRPFTPRDLAMVRLLHSEFQWIYQPDVILSRPDALALSPRQRQTLQYLLAGHSEKQVAAQLRLSHNTVHHYVKALHRHFGVSSRSELLARWVRK